MSSLEDKNKLYNAMVIDEVVLSSQLSSICDLIANTCEFFFKGKISLKTNPFKGFLLEGLPGTGKTEIVKQAARKLDRRMRTVFFTLIDGADIASPRWGDAEKKLKIIFNKIYELKKEKNENAKLLILFDDIESLMISRSANLAKEWHYSINSILFHEIDNLDPSNTILLATTNRMDLVDDAITSRLYLVHVDLIPLEALQEIVLDILEKSGVSHNDIDKILKLVMDNLAQMKEPTIRDAQKITVIECIQNGVWSA